MARKRPIPAASRRALAERYGCQVGDTVPARCAYCDFVGSVAWGTWGWAYFHQLEIDHVLPEALGGDESPANLTLACRPCNRRKRDQIWKAR